MRIDVLVGGHAYFFPKLVPAATMAVALRELVGSEVVPAAPWISRRAGKFYHGFLFDEDAPRRTALFLEYLEDSLGPRAHAAVLLPHEPAAPGTAAACRGTEVVEFVRAARRRFGDHALRCLRLFLSEATERTLARLGQDCESLVDECAAASIPVTSLSAADLQAAPELTAWMHRNYSFNVVRACARRVRPDSALVCGDDGSALAEHLDRCQLRVATHLDLDQIMASFAGDRGPLGSFADWPEAMRAVDEATAGHSTFS